MKLTFASPAPALLKHVSLYYYVDFNYSQIEDIERADVGYLRFMLAGQGVYHFASGHNDRSSDVMLLGPSSRAADYSLTGPLRCFGAVLLPRFWGGITQRPASDFADRALDATPAFSSNLRPLFSMLTAMDSVEAMAQAMDAYLLPMVKPLRPEDELVIAEISKWLAQNPIPAPAVLYSVCNLSSRQVMRLSNHYFGAPPKLLARKFRALRSASLIIGTKGRIADGLTDEYSDQSHMTREIKHFTGLTPRQLQINSNPLMQATLHPRTFRTEAPWT